MSYQQRTVLSDCDTTCWLLRKVVTPDQALKMYQKRNLSEELKHQLRNGTMTNRLVIANVIVFLLIHTILALGRMSDKDLYPVIDAIFAFVFLTHYFTN